MSLVSSEVAACHGVDRVGYKPRNQWLNYYDRSVVSEPRGAKQVKKDNL